MEQAFKLIARATGQLAWALGRNKMGRKPLGIIVADLRKAADIIEEIIRA